MIFVLMTGVMLFIAFITDITRQKIPNWLTFAGLIAGFILHAAIDGWHGLTFSFFGILCGFVPMFVLYLFHGVGAGDVKLFAALGAFMGMEFSLYAMAASILFAGVLAVVILFKRSDWGQRFFQLCFLVFEFLVFKKLSIIINAGKSEERLRFPFMWAVLPGTMYAFIQMASLV